MQFPLRSLASFNLASATVAIWCISAAYFGQSILATQRSSQLMQIGAVNGDMLIAHEYWRLLTSQFLHVHLLHMLFNAICIFVIGAAIEKLLRWHGLLIVYLIGGTVGQLGSVLAYPTLISSGASQALMALCAAAIVVCRSHVRAIALIIVAIQVALDIYVADTVKIGHSVGFGAGLFVALYLFKRDAAKTMST